MYGEFSSDKFDSARQQRGTDSRDPEKGVDLEPPSLLTFTYRKR
jgi:hypothetical protein